MRIRNWTKLSSRDLWTEWAQEFESCPDAEASAVWIANRLVKGAARSTRRKFYEVKDMFLVRYQDSLVEGQKVREERHDCWCGDPEGCDRCDYTGVYRTSTLYCHRLVIAGTRYSFHSYQKPRQLSEIPGEDKESYGGKFTDQEIASLRLPMSGVIRMIRYVAFVSWHSAPPPKEGWRKMPEIVVTPKPVCCFDWPGPRNGDNHHEYCRRSGSLSRVSA